MPRRLSEERIQMIRRLRRRKMSVAEIARTVEVTEATVHRYTDGEMRSRIRETNERKSRGMGYVIGNARRDRALYDPERDGAPKYESDVAQFMGDPPIGRREMLERWDRVHWRTRREGVTVAESCGAYDADASVPAAATTVMEDALAD